MNAPSRIMANGQGDGTPLAALTATRGIRVMAKSLLAQKYSTCNAVEVLRGKDLRGTKFGTLLVAEYLGSHPTRRPQRPERWWRVICDCGEILVTPGRNLLGGYRVRCDKVRNHPRADDTLARLMKFVSVDPTTGCWNWTGAADQNGYGKFGYRGRPQTASRVSWELDNGPIPDGADILHRCDNPPCVNPDHLELGDKSKNSTDAYERGLIGRGEKHPNAKLTDAQVDEIRISKLSGCALAKELGVSPSTVHQIRRGTSRIKKALP